MHKLIHTTLIIISIFILFGCQKQGEKKEFSSFQKTYQLDSASAKKMSFKKKYKYPMLSKHDSLLFAFCSIANHTRTHSMDVYNINTFEHINTVAPKGKGPGEIAGPLFKSMGYHHKSIWICDTKKQKFFKYPLKNIINNTGSTSKPITSIPFPPPSKGRRFIFKIYNYKNKLFLFPNQGDKKNFFSVFNDTGNLIDSLHIPNKTEYLKGVNLKSGATYISTLHPSKQLLAVHIRYTDILLGIKFNGDIKFNIQGPDQFNDSKKEPAIDRKVGIKSLKSDKDFIYTLYSGQEKFGPKNNPKDAKHLHIFDWEGHPIAKITFPYTISPFAFTIDRKNDKIITYSPELGKFVNYKFSMEKLK